MSRSTKWEWRCCHDRQIWIGFSTWDPLFTEITWKREKIIVCFRSSCKQQTNQTNVEGKKGLTGKQITGIVIIIVAVILLVIFILILYKPIGEVGGLP